MNFEPSVEERILKAFLDIVILQMLARSSMTAYQIDKSILKNFGDKMSPTVVYTKLSAMEADSLIACVRSNRGRVHSITDKGGRLAREISTVINEIQAAALTLRVS